MPVAAGKTVALGFIREDKFAAYFYVMHGNGHAVIVSIPKGV